MQINLNDSVGVDAVALETVARSRLAEASSYIVDRLAEIDEQLRLIQRTLDDVQPRLPGRIQIAWWRDRHYQRREGLPVPGRFYFVRLERSGTGFYYQKELPPQRITTRVSSAGAFAPVAVHVRELVALAAELMEYRWALWRQVTKALDLKERFERNSEERLEVIRETTFRLSHAAANDEPVLAERCAVGV